MKTNPDTELVEFSEIVDLVYQGATDAEAWPKVAQKICDWLDARTCIIFTKQFPADQGAFAMTHKYNSLGLYDAKFNAHNIREMHAYERGLLTTSRDTRPRVGH